MCIYIWNFKPILNDVPFCRTFARQSSLYPVELLRKDELANPKSGKEDKTSTTPNQCQSIKVSDDALSSSGSLQSDDILETKTDSTLEEISLANNSPDVKVGFEEEDSKEIFPMDVDICVGGSVSTVSDDLVNQSHEIERSNTLSLTDSSKVEDPTTGGSTGIGTEFSIDNASVPTQNHVDVDEKEQTPVNDSAVPSSHMDSLEFKSTNNCMEKTGKAESSSLNGRHSRGNLKPLFAPGFLDKHSQDKSLKGGEGKKSVKHGQELSNGSISFCRNGGIPSPDISSDNGGSVRNNGANNGSHSKRKKKVRFADELYLDY